MTSAGMTILGVIPDKCDLLLEHESGIHIVCDRFPLLLRKAKLTKAGMTTRAGMIGILSYF
jgi:hypothetical protein